MFIPTNYNGHTFRSMMEARWAVFFDYFGFQWDYEPDGFEVDGEKYLPDFYLRDFDLYVEVKHKNGAQETELARRFARIRQVNIAICDGNPHNRPIMLIGGRPDFDVPGDSKILWFYKPGESILYEATEPSVRPEYKEAIAKANSQRFGVIEIRNMLGQARKKEAMKLEDKILCLKEKYNIKTEEIENIVESIKRFNRSSCLRAFHEVFKNNIDGLTLANKEHIEEFDFNKGFDDN